MKKIKDTKNPTIRQMISMSKNLRKKFKKYSSIQVDVDAHHTSVLGVDVSYRLYIENRENETFKSWQKLLSFYHKLMEEV